LDLTGRFVELVVRLTARARDARPGTAGEALQILGSPPARVSCDGNRAMPLAERARVRFALDDVRAGAMRELELPREADRARTTRRELTALAATAGVTCVTLERVAGARVSNLARVVLTLLLRLGPGARALIEEHGLHRALPLTLISGVPLWDRLGHDEKRARRPNAVRIVAARVAAFFFDAALRCPLALLVDRSALSDPLAAAVVARLRRTIARAKSTRSETGGFLLALPARKGGDTPLFR